MTWMTWKAICKSHEAKNYLTGVKPGTKKVTLKLQLMECNDVLKYEIVKAKRGVQIISANYS